MIEIYRLPTGADEANHIGTVDGGSVVEGDESDLESAGVMQMVEDGMADVLPEMYDGPVLFAVEAARPSGDTDEKSDWVPYQGPQGGEGWRSIETDEITYQNEPPGDVISPAELVDAAVEAGVDPDEARRLTGGLDGASEDIGDSGFTVDEVAALNEDLSIDQMEDFSSDGRFSDPPATIASMDTGDAYGVMNPETFEFEVAVVEEVGDGSVEVNNGSEIYTIGPFDVAQSFSEDGGEAVRESADILESQLTQMDDLGPVREALPDAGFLREEFDERMAGVDTDDPGAVVSELKELIFANNDDYRVDVSMVPRVSDALKEAGVSPPGDGVTGYEAELPDDDVPLGNAVDAVIDGNDFMHDRDRMLALERLADRRVSVDNPAVPETDPASQKSYVEALGRAEEEGLLEHVRGIEREPNDGARGDSFAWAEGNKLVIKNTLNDADVASFHDDGVCVGEDSGDILLHEVGHAVHSESTEGITLGFVGHQLDSELVESEVSKYADASANELVAEVFLGTLRGETYGDEIMDEYDRLGGPGLAAGAEKLDGPGAPDEIDLSALPAPLAEEVVAVAEERDDGGATEKADWVPYQGPQGGEGWRNLDTGEINYSDEPPGGLPDPADMTVDELGNALQAAVGEERAIEVFDEAGGRSDVESVMSQVFDEHAEGRQEVDVSPPPDEISYMDTDWGRTDSKSYTYGSMEDETVTVLADEERNKMWGALEDKHGVAARRHRDMMDSWKTTSYSTEARRREMAFVEALGLSGEPRNGELDAGEQPTENEVRAAEDLAAASKHFVEEHYADDDGNFEVHRGLGQSAGRKLKDDAFAMVANGDSPDFYEMDMNPMTNYSVLQGVAESWGDETATISEKRNVDKVVAATDLMMDEGGGSEGEVSIAGHNTAVRAEDINIHNNINMADLVSGDPSEETLTNAADAMAMDLDEAYRHEPIPDDTLRGMRTVLDRLEEPATDDLEERQRATDALHGSLGLDSWDAFQQAQDAIREVGQSELWGKISGDVPYGAEGEELAAGLVDGLTRRAGPEEAAEVLEEITGESFDLADGHRINRATRLKGEIDDRLGGGE